MIRVWPKPQPQLLLVDDEMPVLEVCGAVIRVSGYAVVTATHPAQAMSIAARHAIDLAILDYHLPTMNGCELALKLKVRFPELATILYSGACDIPDRDLMACDAYVSKGHGPAKLIQVITELLAAQTRLRPAARREHHLLPAICPAGI